MSESPSLVPQSLLSAQGWSPLLDGDLAARAEAAVAAIAAEIPETLPANGLAGGSAGVALFYAYLAQSGRGGEARAHAHLEHAITAMGEGVQWPSFYSGFTGVAWAVEHLQGRLLEPSEEDLNEEIDGALEELLARHPWTTDYDLVSGLVGLGLYALDRLARPSGQRLLREIVLHLDETKTALDGGYAWHTRPGLLPEWQRERDPEGYYNLGLAHGIPGVIALLGQACAFGVDEARPLLEGAVTWMRAQRLPEGLGSCFGTVVSIGEAANREFHPSRVAWCYGDLGLAVALLWAARSVGRADWEAEALDVLRASARRELASAGVMDPGLCHGASGNAHIFNRLWQATGESLFKDAARAWFEFTLNLRKEGEGVGGFQAYMPSTEGEDRSPWVDSPGLLEGAAGVGLGLLAGLAPQRPEWDRFLMVSVPPRERAL